MLRYFIASFLPAKPSAFSLSSIISLSALYWTCSNLALSWSEVSKIVSGMPSPVPRRDYQQIPCDVLGVPLMHPSECLLPEEPWVPVHPGVCCNPQDCDLTSHFPLCTHMWGNPSCSRGRTSYFLQGLWYLCLILKFFRVLLGWTSSCSPTWVLPAQNELCIAARLLMKVLDMVLVLSQGCFADYQSIELVIATLTASNSSKQVVCPVHASAVSRGEGWGRCCSNQGLL